jgi:hypothetical protein
MWPNSSRRQRRSGKHAHAQSPIESGRPTYGELLADVLPSAQTGTAELCSETTLAWLRNQAMQLLELEKIERTRAADLERLIARLGTDCGPYSTGAHEPMQPETQPAAWGEAGPEHWQPQAEAPVQQVPQVDLPGVLAAAKHDAQRLAAVPAPDEDTPLYGSRWMPAAEQPRDGQTREMASLGGVA